MREIEPITQIIIPPETKGWEKVIEAGLEILKNAFLKCQKLRPIKKGEYWRIELALVKEEPDELNPPQSKQEDGESPMKQPTPYIHSSTGHPVVLMTDSRERWCVFVETPEGDLFRLHAFGAHLTLEDAKQELRDYRGDAIRLTESSVSRYQELVGRWI